MQMHKKSSLRRTMIQQKVIITQISVSTPMTQFKQQQKHPTKTSIVPAKQLNFSFAHIFERF